jgi:signal transduction histidine kinase
MMRWVWLWLAAVLLMQDAALAQGLNTITATPTADGPVIDFADGDFILADGLDPPAVGWVRRATPNIYRMRETGWTTGDFHTLVGRFRFDRSALGAEPLAIYTVSTRNQFSVFVNGKEINRNFSTAGDQILSWYRPYLVPLPAGALKPGTNEIVIRAFSEESVGIGQVIVGPNPVMRDNYQTQFFWQITAPLTANFAMLVIGLLMLLLWLGRRQEIELLWLAVSTGLWFLRNSQYYLEEVPFDMVVFNSITVYATYFASVATAAFYFCFTKLPSRNRVIALLFLAGIPLSALHAANLASNLIFYIPTTMLIFGVALSGLIDLKRNRNIEHGVLGAILMIMPVASLYDMSVAGWHRGWNGNGFYLSVFGGFLYSLAFVISFGKRALDAFNALGQTNIVLEKRVAEARAELAASEAARQELVVAHALAGERGRLMQEMHDGIGSNLITALAVARQQKQPMSTIKTLRRALADLKITVDSLEPVEGDLVALIGNLRHRMAGDLHDAGVVCRWEVQPCGVLPWLDAANALHVLRIFQEAIGNVLTHSGASEMRIGCFEQTQAGVAGIAAYVADNGQGFDSGLIDSGAKGLASIRARAQSLHGALSIQSDADSGTVVTLWLPYWRTGAQLTAPLAEGSSEFTHGQSNV